MRASNFTENTLDGRSETYTRAVEELKERYSFDFVAIGLTAFLGAPLKWIYSAGASDDRHHRIVLAPGHGIGGIVIKAGKPMMFVNIDAEIDPREYSSYPIVFAEDLHSFCALPLTKNKRVVGALLCAFRSVCEDHEEVYGRLIEELQNKLCDLDLITHDFMNFDHVESQREDKGQDTPFLAHSQIARIISAQEEERKRISRELHDGIAQELLAVSFLFNRLQPHVIQSKEARSIFGEAHANIDRIMDELHNLSVALRPSALDHLGFIPALRSQASLLEKVYGTQIVFEGSLSRARFDQALETQAYRICQEAMVNACKYADTSEVYITLEDADDWLHASIIDYGGGFNTNLPPIKGSGCGLSGMKERAKLIGATLNITSSAQGTEVVLVAPMYIAEGDREGDE